MFKFFKSFTVVAVLAASVGVAEAASKKGSFSGQGKYSVSGTATLSDAGKLTLSGFKSSSGPDLYVYVGTGSKPTKRIAKLKRLNGSQTYSLPASVAKTVKSVHIYCKRFSVNFGSARLR